MVNSEELRKQMIREAEEERRLKEEERERRKCKKEMHNIKELMLFLNLVEIDKQLQLQQHVKQNL